MSYRFNFTGRKRIPRECINIRVIEHPEGAPEFSAVINLPEEFGLSPDARVYVEPYVKSSTMRFMFGTVSKISAPDNRLLTEIDAGGSILFRVKVVDESEQVGKILAAAHGLRPRSEEDGDDRKPLLPLRTRDLGEELWKLEFSTDAGPELVINNRIATIADQIRTSPLLQAAVFPEIVRQMTCNAFRSDVDDDVEWVIDWKAFLSEQLGEQIDEDDLPEEDAELSEALQDLGERIAASFASKQRFITRMQALSERDNG